jgi:hypothetical protein
MDGKEDLAYAVPRWSSGPTQCGKSIKVQVNNVDGAKLMSDIRMHLRSLAD